MMVRSRPRCAPGTHKPYNQAKPNTRVTKCSVCRMSLWISKDPPVTVPRNLPDLQPEPARPKPPQPEPELVPETEHWSGTCTECGQTWESDTGPVTYCPDCEIKWTCGACPATRIFSRKDTDFYPQCEICGWQETQTLTDLLAS